VCEATRAAGPGVCTALRYIANIVVAAELTFVTVGPLAVDEALAYIFRVP